jgi:putative transposase
LAGEAIPGGRGVENFNLGLAGEPVRDWPLLGEEIITKLVVITMRAKAVMDNLWAFFIKLDMIGTTVKIECRYAHFNPMKARYQYRIYPTNQQKKLLSQLFGCVRVVWNNTLAYCQKLYQQGEKKPKYTELSKRLTQIKKTEEKNWLTEVSSIPLQQSLRDLETAYSNFFASCQGERKGKKVKPPKFKKRKFKQSARFTDNGFTVNQHHVTLAKIGDLKVI